MLRGDGDSVMTVSTSRPEARSRFGRQTANELGAPVASSIPEQLPGREPASARKGYEDGNALVLRNRCSEGALDVMLLPEQQCLSVRNDVDGWAELVEQLRSFAVAAIGLEATGGYERGIMRGRLAAGMSARALNT